MSDPRYIRGMINSRNVHDQPDIEMEKAIPQKRFGFVGSAKRQEIVGYVVKRKRQTPCSRQSSRLAGFVTTTFPALLMSDRRFCVISGWDAERVFVE